MKLTPSPLHQYHVFLASPGDVGVERQYVRRFFDEYNRHTAHLWRVRFEVVDWENYATIGVGRPQELITQQTLEKYRESLALVIGLMAQRFGSPTGKAESGTEEEFNWAMESHNAAGFPEIKWFFRKVDKLDGLPADPAEAIKALEQWQKVLAFRKRMQDLDNPVFYAEYPSAAAFAEVFAHDLNHWLADSARPWAAERAAYVSATGAAAAVALPAEFDAERYRAAVLRRFDRLNFEMLDTTGAFYSGVRLWSVFVPQSVRELHQYNPRLLEIPKEHQRRLLDAGEIAIEELKETERQADRLRQEYFQQPLRAVLDVADETLRASLTGAGRRLVILGDPGSGKSSLIRYLALRWAGTAEPEARDTQPIPLVIELGPYSRWQCSGRKDFVRYLEEAPVWHEWPRGLLGRLIEQPGRVVLLLDGLDEVFNAKTRTEVIDDIQRFSNQFANTPIIVTSRVVGYQQQRLRDAEFRHFMVQDLDAGQIADFVDRWHEVTFDNPGQAAPKRDRLHKAIRESRSIAMLAGNPLLLTMMAILNRNQELPRDRADLYAQASRVLLHQWDTERALVDFPGISAEIGLREKTDILRRIAAHMQAGATGLKGNLIDGPTLTGLIEDYLQYELHFAQARGVARAVVDQLRQRNFILCFVGADSYAFVHRTFLEYFYAADVVHRFNVAKTLDESTLVALFDVHYGDDEWHEVLRLICGQIDEVFVAAIVASLLRHDDLDTWDGHRYLHGLGLSVSIATEMRNPALLGTAAVDLLDSLLFVVAEAGGPFQDASMIRQMDEIANAVEVIGLRWPGVKERLPLATPKFKWYGGGGMRIWPRVVIAFQDADRRAKLCEFALSGSAPEFRAGALEALAEKWPDETTRALLAERAVQDEDEGPRGAALKGLVEKWPDETTRALLAERAVQDEDEGPRSVAPPAFPRSAMLQVLAEKWPDETTRALAAERAVQDKDKGLRRVALQALAEKWPDETTRALLAECAVQDEDEGPRSAALQALAEKWPDETTRALLTKRAVQDKDEGPRRVALQALAAKWPDETTRALLGERAVQDEDEGPRRVALQALAEKWPDETTRALLGERAVQDEGKGPRSAALQALAEKWPDETTRALLAECAVQDEDEGPRRAALQALAENWPDDTTRALLAERAVQDEDEGPRRAALEALAEKWPDDTTRALLAERAVQDEEEGLRSAALQVLAEKWPDQSTRDLLTHRAVEDQDGEPRHAALQALAEKWPDQGTRDLLTHRALEDQDGRHRSNALQALAEKWPDQSTRDLLAQRAVHDDNEHTRSAACFALGNMHSDFGRILLTRDLDGLPPYLDPLKRISRENIENAGAKAGMSPNEIDAAVASLSVHLGWDVTRGAKNKAVKAAGRTKQGRKRGH